jgi:hypothetical protein
MYAIIQSHAVNSNLWAVAKLHTDAYKSPAGYIVGKHDIVAKDLTEAEARSLINKLESN